MGSRKQTNNGASSRDTEAGDPAPPELQDLHQVRQILFGAHAQDTADRFARLETELRKQAAGLREELREKFERLENRLKDEVEDLVTRVESEAATRSTLDDRVQKGEETLREKLENELRTARSEAEERCEALADQSERSIEQLSADKVDHSALATLLREMAERINPVPESSDS